MDPVDSKEKSPVTEEEAAKDDHCSEEEIEFVSEEHSKPVLECIDLLTSSDDEHFLLHRKPKDHIDYEKERVTSTLDRLAQRVEVQKQQRAEKTKAFKEKLNNQHAHGLQQLECIKDLPSKSDAKFCVSQWLKMPGLRPGTVSSSRRRFVQPQELGSINSQPIACPIMHCNRKFDNGPLLFGHLKRFDHSPCDPTITLHGECDKRYACLICLQQFATNALYNAHLFVETLADHERLIPSIVIECFACPSCFLLFNQRDECLKHMSSNNHFVRSFTLRGEKGIPCPVPIPSYAKKILIALCKDIPFQVVCTSCHSELRSHVEVTAHFRTRCRKAGPVSFSERSICDVASIFQLKAVCLDCRRVLSDETRIAKHVEKTSHKVKEIASIEESFLAFCYVNEGAKTPSDFCLSAANARMKPCSLKRTLNDDYDLCNILPKCKKESERITIDECRLKKESSLAVTAWFCECSQQFSSEKAAEKHIMAANGIFHKCLVCGKLADDSAIIQLHMSRFHGGAHLNNFRFWCQICRIEMTKIEDPLTHIADCHGGHCFYFEKEVFEEPSTSPQTESSISVSESVSPSSSQQSAKGLWQCHVCEEMFDSENTVQQHCKSLAIHQFHKYCCDTCKKKFHKIETLLRHSQLQHDGNIKVKYFCGLCEDVFFDEEIDFLAHHESYHSLDYSFVPNQAHSPTKSPEVSSTTSAEGENRLTCGCLAEYSVKAIKKLDGKLCLARLFEKGKLWYGCCLCSATDQTFEGLCTHHCKKEVRSTGKTFVIKCSVCSKSFIDPGGAQEHYHTKHCFLEKTSNYYSFGNEGAKSEMFKFTASGTSGNEKPGNTCAKQFNYETQDRVPNASTKMTGKCIQESEAMEVQHADTGSQEYELPDMDFLRTMTNIVFIDLDNWAQFFSHLPGYLNQGTFVWGFQGGKGAWKPPINCAFFKHLSNTGCFFLHPRCSDRKDAADFAICMHAGRLDEQLPKGIPFTILSGDKGFMELENQFKKTQRSAHILNPHHLGGDVMCALLNSISETTQDTLHGGDDDDMEVNSMGQNEDADMKEAIKRSMLEM